MKRPFIRGYLSRQIFLYLLLFSVIIVGFIGFTMQTVIPQRYLDSQLLELEKAESEVRTAYQGGDTQKVVEILERVQEKVGGKLYYTDSTGTHGSMMGRKMRQGMQEGSERKLTDDITVTRFINKAGLDIKAIDVRLSDRILSYEVSIQDLERASGIMMEFTWILLLIALLLSMLLSYLLSKNISEPVKRLNRLAESMKGREVEPDFRVERVDEIGILNRTLNELYEELRGTIYRLNTELSKERNSELLKKRFLAQATHELKTPVAVISGYSEIIYDGMYKDEEELSGYIANIHRETETISVLLNDILDYTKLETGNFRVDMKEVNINTGLMPIIESFRPIAERKGLRFTIVNNVSSGFLRRMDPTRITQVYTNLVTNAMNHAESSIITEISEVGERLRISVMNDGERIDEKDLPHIFESFYKSPARKEGSGLGLAIVKEIVTLHKGEYLARNLDDGVQFVVMI